MSSLPKTVAERLLFVRQFVASPRKVGSITPSSRYLVRTLLSLADVPAVREVVELGPGTGPFTAGLLDAMSPDARLLCVERDPALAEHLRARFADPRLIVVTADAQNLPELLAANGFRERVPLIVSGLPFTSLPPQMREAIIGAILASLAPDGDFLLYQYSPAMRGFLRRHFREVQSRWEPRNVPPAICMRCRV
jgi:phosphatidylethanolamine/phosphatidyl-N-methylethanolamine N-methyltransferase